MHPGVATLANVDEARERRVAYQPTRPTAVSIGERRRPEPNGLPGYFRVDSVHQGDLDGVKGCTTSTPWMRSRNGRWWGLRPRSVNPTCCRCWQPIRTGDSDRLARSSAFPPIRGQGACAQSAYPRRRPADRPVRLPARGSAVRFRPAAGACAGRGLPGHAGNPRGGAGTPCQ